MTEVKVKQRTPEWFELRENVTLTASKFGEALGLGRGKPYDFLESLVWNEYVDPENNKHTHHGLTLEPIIDEAYQLLTRNMTTESGFWLPANTTILHNLVGASPDAKVLDRATGKVVGLVEYKAPVYSLYKPESFANHGIPRTYMAQIQGQMAIAGLPWCDFMAVCRATKSILLKRVYFNPAYWSQAAGRLHTFCKALQEAMKRKYNGDPPLDFPAAKSILQQPMTRGFLPGEASIKVTNLIQQNNGRFRSNGSKGQWLSFDFLLGEPHALPEELYGYGNKLLQEVDAKTVTAREH